MAIVRTDDQHYKDIADAIREKTGGTEDLLPENMAEELNNATLEELTVTPSSEVQTFEPTSPCIGFSIVTVEAAESGGGGGEVLPDDDGGSVATVPAESAGFGVGESEYGIVTVPSDFFVKTSGYNYGWRFRAREAITVMGFRHYQYNRAGNPLPMYLWDNETETKIIEVTIPGLVTEGSGVWAEILFTDPISLTAESVYTVSSFCNAVMTSSAPDYNSKISYMSTRQSSSSSSLPKTSISGYPMFDIIIGEPELEKNYTVQRTTMDAIANQVKRITGKRQSMTASEMASALANVPTMT